MKRKICQHATDKNKWVWVWSLWQVEGMELVPTRTVLRDKTPFKEKEKSKEGIDRSDYQIIIKSKKRNINKNHLKKHSWMKLNTKLLFHSWTSKRWYWSKRKRKKRVRMRHKTLSKYKLEWAKEQISNQFKNICNSKAISNQYQKSTSWLATWTSYILSKGKSLKYQLKVIISTKMILNGSNTFPNNR